MTVQSPINLACLAPNAIDDGRQLLGSFQDQFRGLQAECWIIVAFYLTSIGSGIFAAVKIF